MNEENVAVERVVMCEITHDDLLEMVPPVPFAVQVRLKLNKHGFEFEDDNTVASILNVEPKPLGKVICWEDYKTGSIHYKQILNT